MAHQYNSNTIESSGSGFGTTSPPPNMYDTSTSTAESSRTPKGYPNTTSSSARSKLKAKSKATQYAASMSTNANNSMDHQQYGTTPPSNSSYQQPSPSRRTTAGSVGSSGGFRSQAALLVGNHQQHSEHQQQPSHRHPSPSRPSRRSMPNPRTGGSSRAAQETVSDVSAPASFPSAAASYIHQQQQQQSPSRPSSSSSLQNHSQKHPPQTTSGGSYPRSSADNYSTASNHSRLQQHINNHKDGTSVTEMSSSVAPTITTQSEPGATTYSHYSYYTTLTDHYSSSATPQSTAPSPRFSSRFAATLEHGNNHNSHNREADRSSSRRMSSGGEDQSMSHQPLIQQQQHQRMPSDATSSTYGTSPRYTNATSSTTANIGGRSNPFSSSQRPAPTNNNKPPMSVSERIRQLSQNTLHYPDPEPAFVEDESENQDQQHKEPLMPFYNGPVIEGRNENNAPSSQQQQDRYAIKSGGRYHSSGDTAPSTTPSSNSTHHHHYDAINSSAQSEPHHHLYVPASVRHSRATDVTLDTEGGDTRHTSTSLPPVRRRKPLQQPAYHSPEQQQQGQEKEAAPAKQQQQAQTRHSMPTGGSPSRVQEMKRMLWSEDEKLNTSSDSIPAVHRREGRSLSPRQHRHSTGSTMRNVPATTTAAASSATGGFKSKFYQAAMAAQRGERTSTPPRPRPMMSNEESPHRPTTRGSITSGTPPRPRSSSMGPSPYHTQRPASGRPESPTPPRPSQQQQQEQAVLQKSPTMPPVSSYQRNAPVSPQRTRPIQIQESSSQIHHQMSLPTQQQQEEPLFPKEQFEDYRPPQPEQQPPQQQETSRAAQDQAAHQDGKDYIAMLVAKLSAVQRDDPQAALAQIDSILRAECHGSSEHAMLVNAAAAAAGVVPQQQYGQPPQRQEQEATHAMTPMGRPKQQNIFHSNRHLYPQHQDFPGQQNGQGVATQQPSANPGDPGIQDDEETSDDDTSVSSITNPTYRSAMPTHEQIHDMPPPSGISTSLYRRPRPNGLQGYNTPAPTPAISGLELVQRHHQRQAARKGFRGAPLIDQPQAYNHQMNHAQHLPPATINVTSDSVSHLNSTRAFTENLLKSSSKSPRDHHHDIQHETASSAQKANQPTGQLGSKAANQLHIDEYGFAAMQHNQMAGNMQPQQEHRLHVTSSPPENSEKRSPSQNPAQENGRSPRSGTAEPSSSGSGSKENKAVNPFDGSIDDSAKPRYTMSGGSGKERKLDLFMSRKKTTEEELKSLQQQEEEIQQLTGEALARKIQAWDELSAHNSKVSSKSSAEVNDKAPPSSQFSAGTNSAGGNPEYAPAAEMDAVNVSTASMSLGTSSLLSRNSRKSHPWNAEKPGSTLKIDFRDTSMDNALGVEAECFSQSQASPARDLRKAAREQKQQRLIQQKLSEESFEKSVDEQQNSASVGQEPAPQNTAQTPMQQEVDEAVSPTFMSQGQGNTRTRQMEDDRNFEAALGPQPEFPSQLDEEMEQPPYSDSEQIEDKGYEVTPVYGSNQQAKGQVPHDRSDNWVAVPSNSYFNSKTKSTKPQVVATLVDEDSHPVTMVRSPELPSVIADAFADVPVPYDEPEPPRVNPPPPSMNRKFGGDDVIDVSDLQETPPPPRAAEATPRGRRAFANFLKKRAKGGKKSTPSTPTKKQSLASAIELPESERDCGLGSSSRGRRTVSKSPAPKSRTRSLDDTGRIRNPTIAKKFSRLMRVYGNEPSAPGYI